MAGLKRIGFVAKIDRYLSGLTQNIIGCYRLVTESETIEIICFCSKS